MGLLPDILDGHVLDQEALDEQKRYREEMEARRQAKMFATSQGIKLTDKSKVFICKRNGKTS